MVVLSETLISSEFKSLPNSSVKESPKHEDSF